MLTIRFYDYECDMVLSFIENMKGFKELARSKKILFEYIVGDVRGHKISNAMYVSPANSFVTMGGGLDGILDRMFDIQEKAYDNVTLYGVENEDGEMFLPVGDSVATEMKDECFLLSCPTMYYPSNIEGTMNVYHATLSALVLANKINGKYGTKYLYLPGMGTGVGGMSYDEAGKQMAFAMKHFLNDEYIDSSNEIVHCVIQHKEKLE